MENASLLIDQQTRPKPRNNFHFTYRGKYSDTTYSFLPTELDANESFFVFRRAKPWRKGRRRGETQQSMMTAERHDHHRENVDLVFANGWKTRGMDVCRYRLHERHVRISYDDVRQIHQTMQLSTYCIVSHHRDFYSEIAEVPGCIDERQRMIEDRSCCEKERDTRETEYHDRPGYWLLVFPFFPLSLIVIRDIRFYRSQESFLLCVHILEILF